MIRFVVVGKLKSEWARSACEDYFKRIRRFAKPELREVSDSDPEREGAEILSGIGQSTLVACDPGGKAWSSEELAELLGREGAVSFVIGGPEGLSAKVLARANHKIAFGRITLPHELARVVLLEQVYRGFTILRGHPYHR